MTIQESKRANIMYQVKKTFAKRGKSKTWAFFATHTTLNKRGRAPANKITRERQENSLALVQKKYEDFGPTLAVEKLKQKEHVNISRETLRKWMIKAGIWRSKRKKQVKLYQRRQRRSCFGELQQIDGSYHPWFEDRTEKCCLIICVALCNVPVRFSQKPSAKLFSSM